MAQVHIIEKGEKYTGQLQRGDIVKVNNAYRNDGLKIYDGTKLVKLNFDLIDYGTLPDEFLPIEEGKSLDFWHQDNGITHNTLIPVLRDTILNNITTKPKYGLIPNVGYRIYLTFTFQGVEYYLIYNTGSEDYDQIDEKNSAYFDDKLAKKRLNEFKKKLTKFHRVVHLYFEDPESEVQHDNFLYLDPIFR